jgi:hypothetical protein
MNQQRVQEIELQADQFIAAALALAPSPIVRPTPTKKMQEQCSPLVEVGFSENVVGRVAEVHWEHRRLCRYDPHCAWCHQAGKEAMQQRDYQEMDDLAFSKLLKLVRKGDSRAVMFYLEWRRDQSKGGLLRRVCARITGGAQSWWKSTVATIFALRGIRTGTGRSG